MRETVQLWSAGEAWLRCGVVWGEYHTKAACLGATYVHVKTTAQLRGGGNLGTCLENAPHQAALDRSTMSIFSFPSPEQRQTFIPGWRRRAAVPRPQSQVDPLNYSLQLTLNFSTLSNPLPHSPHRLRSRAQPPQHPSATPCILGISLHASLTRSLLKTPLSQRGGGRGALKRSRWPGDVPPPGLQQPSDP